MESRTVTFILLIGGLIWFGIFLMFYKQLEYIMSIMYLFSALTWLSCGVANHIINKKGN